MARPAPHLLDPANYRLRTEVGLRYSDLDVNRHLNNVKLIDILQEGRGYLHRVSGMSEAPKSTVFALICLMPPPEPMD